MQKTPRRNSGLSPEHKVALSEALAMRSNGSTAEAAVAHLKSHGMPSVVAKVLLKQYDRTSETALLKQATQGSQPAPTSQY